MKNPTYDNYVIKPVKITEIESYIKAICTVYHPKRYVVQKKFINWAYQSIFKNKFVKDSELTIMTAINKNTSKIEAVIGFIGTTSFVKNKELATSWSIQYFNFSNLPGLAVQVLKYLNTKVEIHCGNNLNNQCLRSYQRTFDKKNFMSEVSRKVAIIDGVNCDKLFNSEKNLERSNFLIESASRLTKCKSNQISDLSVISEKYWEDHMERFQNSSDRRIKYLNWRFIKHPYMKYNILSLDPKAANGLAIVRIEKMKNTNFNALRILDLLPVKGFEADIQNLVLNFAKDNNCIIADFFCSFEKKMDEICFHPFINFEIHRNFNIPYRLQPPEIIEKKSFNLFINFNNYKDLLTEEFYTTKTDGEMDLYFDQSGGESSNIE